MMAGRMPGKSGMAGRSWMTNKSWMTDKSWVAGRMTGWRVGAR